MPNCTVSQVPFTKLGRRAIDVRFDGGDVTSDGGLLLLRQVERRLGLLKAVAKVLPDPRDPVLVRHTTEQLLRQRVYGLCQGYEDLNDHDRLRDDLALQTAVGKDQAGASSPTLCRFENRADRKTAVATQRILIDQFIASFKKAPEELVLDFDATDDRGSGQSGRSPLQRLLRQLWLPAAVRFLRRAIAGAPICARRNTTRRCMRRRL